MTNVIQYLKFNQILKQILLKNSREKKQYCTNGFSDVFSFCVPIRDLMANKIEDIDDEAFVELKKLEDM